MQNEGIIFNEKARTFLRYLAEQGAEEYIRSALRAYDLLVHEFGPGIECIFSMNFYDGCCPKLSVAISSIPADLQESYRERIGKVQDTLCKLIPYTGAKIVLVMAR